MPTPLPIGILGGTFDPVHCGHLSLASSLFKTGKLSKILFLPCYQPVHRPPPIATPDQRMAMIEFSIESEPHFILDKREIQRQTPSYMIDSVIDLKKEYTENSLCLILGKDVYLHFTSWKSWKDLFNYINLIVVNRDSTVNDLSPLLEGQAIKPLTHLTPTSLGEIFFHPMTPCPVSATQIRQSIKEGQNIENEVPYKVAQYIKENHLYL